MANNRPTGRNKTYVSGGGNASRRGSGLGSGPVGGGRRPSGGTGTGGNGTGGNGTRGTSGGGLLAVLAALLLGKKLGSGGSGKKSTLSRILLIIAVIVVIIILVRSCSSEGQSCLPGVDGTAYEEEPYDAGDVSEPVEAPAATSAATDIGALFSTLDGSTSPVSSTDAEYTTHEADAAVASSARERYTVLRGGGRDTVTVMVFMCGSTLESNSGLATADLQEMTDAVLSDQVNVIVETGGAASWRNNVVNARTNQRYQILDGGIKALDKDVGNRSMVEPDTLSDFIRYCKQQFPADRYALIFWDHGGGSLSGFGYDEHFPTGTMTLDKINTALRDGGCQFDFIGFDTCLMATLETAIVAEQYADYLIASEAVEPGGGWDYRGFLTALSQNTSLPTVELGKRIIDDYVTASARTAPSSYATLSLTDLAELSGTLPDAFRSFSESTGALISADGYAQVADARGGARDFSSSKKINQIDLIHFAENLGTDEGDALVRVLEGCIKYNRTSSNITHANGLSIYFPYNSLSSVSTAIDTYEKVGLDESYTDCIRSFASMTAGGSVTSGGSGNPLGTLMGDPNGSLLGTLLGADTGASSGTGDMVSMLLGAFLGGDRSIVTGDPDSSWVDEELLNRSAAYFTKTSAGLNALMLTENAAGERVLQLSEEQWALVRMLELNVFLDDGEGYIDLGLDNVFSWDDDGNLLMEYDGTWLSLNGQIVSYYFVSQEQIDDRVIITGRVPALLNGKRADVILAFDDQSPAGRVTGARLVTEEPATQMKGLVEILPGDTLDFLCDYYAYDGTYLDSYYLGEQMTATGQWVVGNAPIGEHPAVMTYRLTDVYGAQYWTPAVR